MQELITQFKDPEILQSNVTFVLVADNNNPEVVGEMVLHVRF